MEYKDLIINKEYDHIMIVTLNRPEKLNTINKSLGNELINLLEELKQDVDTRVVIFNGAGKYFCGGVDMKESSEPTTLLKARRNYERGPNLIRKIYHMDQISIAAVHGGAYGGGACIAAASDFRFGTKDCKAGFPECTLGMNLSWKILPIVVHLIGPTNAKKMTMLGIIDADDLLKWGFFEQLTSKEELMPVTVEFAKKFAALPPIAAQMIKQSINHISSALDEAVMHMDTDQWLLTSKTKDFQEGIKAFFEKRKGNFIGD